jgi:hypothetical protein
MSWETSLSDGDMLWLIDAPYLFDVNKADAKEKSLRIVAGR